MGASAARESKTKQGPRRSFRSKLLSKTGSVRRAAQIYCTGPSERTFHSECISLNGELKGAQRSSGIQDETKYQSKLPLEITFQTGAERRAAQIHCVGPFEMALHSEWIPQNWDREVEMTSTRNGLPFGMAAEQPPKAPLAHPPRTLEAQRPLYPMCPLSQLQRGLWPSNSQEPFSPRGRAKRV